MRFRAPARGEVEAERFALPVFAGYLRHLDLLLGRDWPELAELNRRAASAAAGIRFVEQNAALLADGRHYEARIADSGQVATRTSNWHDLLNALVWIEHPALKRALNRRQVGDVRRVGPKRRTRGQCALTHFDEAGVMILLRGVDPMPAWDRHDWSTLFVDHGADWRHAVEIVVFGHALLEHALVPEASLVGKCLVVAAAAMPTADCLAGLARAIAESTVLLDPQELRPLPMLGLPGWHSRAGEPAFYQSHPCFQPLRSGRCYPPVLGLPP